MTDNEQTIFACFAHPDDEIACVGSLCNHVDRGDKVVLAWTTSGELASHFNGMEFDEVKKIREEQGKVVGEIIGCETLFLGYGDTHVRSTRENALKMAKVIAEVKPDAVITWSLNTRHPDHRGTANIIYDALTYARIPHITEPSAPHRPPLHIPMFLYYEEFSTLPVIHIDISKNFEKVEKIANLYGDFYKWTRVSDWITTMKHADGLRCGVMYG
ncbi:MAG: PIG-L deacetylase family protein [Candidatus Heimdallarchaeaceae archaeon]|jgi:LmbE family N-acetylglucosaminyl deacetylase